MSPTSPQPCALKLKAVMGSSTSLLGSGPSLLLQRFQDVICASIMGGWNGGMWKL